MPAALMIFQDGHTYVGEKGKFRVPIVFDNLIHKKEMPVTVGVFVNPGHKGAEKPKPGWGDKNNRSFEYDSVSDLYARERFASKLGEVLDYHNFVLANYYKVEVLDFQRILDESMRHAEILGELQQGLRSRVERRAQIRAGKRDDGQIGSHLSPPGPARFCERARPRVPRCACSATPSRPSFRRPYGAA